MSEHEAPRPLTDPEAISAVSTFLSTTVAAALDHHRRTGK